MKKWFALFGLLLPMMALAEAPLLEDAGMIRRYTAEDGQEIMYTAWCEEEFVTVEDVNFDGVDDLAALTICGASNLGYTFFVATDDGYRRVEDPAIMMNYQLLPEQRAVLTWVDEGWSGSLCSMNLYAWRGEELVLVRRAYSVLTEDGSLRLAMRVEEVSGEENVLIWQANVPWDAEDAVSVTLGEMHDALLNGWTADLE